MSNIRGRLRKALESDCAEDICQIIDEKRPEDFAALRTFLSLDPSINPKLRTKAIYALGRWGDPVVVPGITKIMPKLDEPGRISGTDALSRLGTTNALEAVAERANDPSPNVRKIVVRALGKMKNPEAKTKLKAIATSDPEEWIRSSASKYLG